MGDYHTLDDFLDAKANAMNAEENFAAWQAYEAQPYVQDLLRRLEREAAERARANSIILGVLVIIGLIITLVTA